MKRNAIKALAACAADLTAKALAAAVFVAAIPAFAAIEIRSDYPGGNVKVLGIDETNGVVRVAPDLRDTDGKWFHFDFTVRGAAGRTLRFQFPQDKFAYLASLGPAISKDGGKSWKWLNADGTRYRPIDCFNYAFGAGVQGTGRAGIVREGDRVFRPSFAEPARGPARDRPLHRLRLASGGERALAQIQAELDCGAEGRKAFVRREEGLCQHEGEARRRHRGWLFNRAPLGAGPSQLLAFRLLRVRLFSLRRRVFAGWRAGART